MSLESRYRGDQFTVMENDNIFNFRNRGIVRYKNIKKGEFYLHPSRWKKPVRDELFIVKFGTLPPEHQYVEVTIQETGEIIKSPHPVPRNTRDFDKQEIQYVTGWELRDPNELRRNPLTTPEMFIEQISLPFSHKIEDFPNLKHSIASHLMSSPQRIEFEKGGMNSLIFGNRKVLERQKLFDIITGVIPSEFRSTKSEFYYSTLQTAKVVSPVNSIEVNLAYLNSEIIPIHLPILFDVDFKPKSRYLSDFNHYSGLLQTFILDGINFNPSIPVSLEKIMEDIMQDIFDKVTMNETIPYCQELGSSLCKISSGIARTNHERYVTREDLIAGANLLIENYVDATKYMKNIYGLDYVFQLNVNARKLLILLRDMHDTGLPLLVLDVLNRSKLSDIEFKEAIMMLDKAAFIYFPNPLIIKLRES